MSYPQHSRPGHHGQRFADCCGGDKEDVLWFLDPHQLGFLDVQCGMESICIEAKGAGGGGGGCLEEFIREECDCCDESYKSCKNTRAKCRPLCDNPASSGGGGGSGFKRIVEFRVEDAKNSCCGQEKKRDSHLRPSDKLFFRVGKGGKAGKDEKHIHQNSNFDGQFFTCHDGEAGKASEVYLNTVPEPGYDSGRHHSGRRCGDDYEDFYECDGQGSSTNPPRRNPAFTGAGCRPQNVCVLVRAIGGCGGVAGRPDLGGDGGAGEVGGGGGNSPSGQPGKGGMGKTVDLNGEDGSEKSGGDGGTANSIYGLGSPCGGGGGGGCFASSALPSFKVQNDDECCKHEKNCRRIEGYEYDTEVRCGCKRNDCQTCIKERIEVECCKPKPHATPYPGCVPRGQYKCCNKKDICVRTANHARQNSGDGGGGASCICKCRIASPGADGYIKVIIKWKGKCCEKKGCDKCKCEIRGESGCSQNRSD